MRVYVLPLFEISSKASAPVVTFFLLLIFSPNCPSPVENYNPARSPCHSHPSQKTTPQSLCHFFNFSESLKGFKDQTPFIVNRGPEMVRDPILGHPHRAKKGKKFHIRPPPFFLYLEMNMGSEKSATSRPWKLRSKKDIHLHPPYHREVFPRGEL